MEDGAKGETSWCWSQWRSWPTGVGDGGGGVGGDGSGGVGEMAGGGASMSMVTEKSANPTEDGARGETSWCWSQWRSWRPTGVGVGGGVGGGVGQMAGGGASMVMEKSAKPSGRGSTDIAPLPPLGEL
jgi:hypothetical protein